MKKILVMLVAMMLVSSVAHAGTYQFTYQVKNTTGAAQTTVIPQVAIPKGSTILWFDVQQLNRTLHSENWAEVYDETTGICSGEVMGEIEALNFSVATKVFPGGRIVMSGVCVRQGPNTIVSVCFER